MSAKCYFTESFARSKTKLLQPALKKKNKRNISDKAKLLAFWQHFFWPNKDSWSLWFPVKTNNWIIYVCGTHTDKQFWLADSKAEHYVFDYDWWRLLGKLRSSIYRKKWIKHKLSSEYCISKTKNLLSFRINFFLLVAEEEEVKRNKYFLEYSIFTLSLFCLFLSVK